jgi:hypothetical protein
MSKLANYLDYEPFGNRYIVHGTGASMCKAGGNLWRVYLHHKLCGHALTVAGGVEMMRVIAGDFHIPAGVKL